MPRGVEWKHCRGCSKPKNAERTLSRTGLCNDCVRRRIRANAIQLRLGAGPYYQRWEDAIIAGIRGKRLDDKSHAA